MLGNWFRGIREWCRSTRPVKVGGSKEERRNVVKIAGASAMGSTLSLRIVAQHLRRGVAGWAIQIPYCNMAPLLI